MPLVCVVWCFLAISYSVGWTKKGVVDEIDKLPYFGGYLEGFEVIGNISYQRREYARGVNCFFSGRTSIDSFNKFCNQTDGWEFTPVYSMTIDYWRDMIESAGQDPCTFPLDDIKAKKCAYKTTNIDGETLIIKILFIEEDESFIAFASKTRSD